MFNKIDNYPVDAYRGGDAYSGSVKRDNEPFVIASNIIIDKVDPESKMVVNDRRICFGIQTVEELGGLIGMVTGTEHDELQKSYRDLMENYQQLLLDNDDLRNDLSAIQTALTRIGFSMAPQEKVEEDVVGDDTVEQPVVAIDIVSVAIDPPQQEVVLQVEDDDEGLSYVEMAEKALNSGIPKPRPVRKGAK